MPAEKTQKDPRQEKRILDRKSTRLNSSHGYISYAVFCLKKKTTLKPCEANKNRCTDPRSLNRVYSTTRTVTVGSYSNGGGHCAIADLHCPPTPAAPAYCN